jgi:hypothetical protein
MKKLTNLTSACEQLCIFLTVGRGFAEKLSENRRDYNQWWSHRKGQFEQNDHRLTLVPQRKLIEIGQKMTMMQKCFTFLERSHFNVT